VTLTLFGCLSPANPVTGAVSPSGSLCAISWSWSIPFIPFTWVPSSAPSPPCPSSPSGWGASGSMSSLPNRS
jgi:hypothetical protein